MLGKQLKLLRETAGKSQLEVCSALNIEQSTLAEYYKVSVDCILGLEKIGSSRDCYDYFYEDGLANWNIRKKCEELGISYEDALSKTDIVKERFDQLWFGANQPCAEELIRFSHVLNVSIDYLLDESRRDKLDTKEAMVLNYYNKYPDEVMDLLEAFCSLSRKQRTIVIGKCFELEASTTVAADDSPLKKASGK